MTKRFFDLVAAAVGLVVAAPLLAAAAVAIRLDSKGPVFFTQERIGRGMQPFRIYKLRTMQAGPGGPEVTREGDSRVTRVGRFLRAARIDEVPQLVNVLKGEMSLVGPRPEVAGYVEEYPAEFAEILDGLRPGITGLATLHYRHEAELLESVADGGGDPEQAYLEEILPEKLRLERLYLEQRSFGLDLRVIFATLTRRPGPDLEA
jgi:lipopolysaccharide/colanic/teichoic acid biosynthesis glycosyltransferase